MEHPGTAFRRILLLCCCLLLGSFAVAEEHESATQPPPAVDAEERDGAAADDDGTAADAGSANEVAPVGAAAVDDQDPATTAPEGSTLAPAEEPVAIARIDGMIDPKRERYLRRIIEDARDRGIQTIILHINTDGGYVFSGRDILKTLLDQAKDGPRLIAFIDYRAISAGAMIAYGCDEIVMTPSASIGDIGVIRMTPDGGIEYAPEKMEAPVRTRLAQCSEIRGWSRGMLLKMTARNQLLYRVTTEEGYDYIIEDDWPAYLADHPDLDPDDKQEVIVFRGEDRLLTLTGKEAVDYDMATTLVDSKQELFERLQVDESELIDLQPTATEQTAWFLSSYAGLFLGLAILFAFLELKTAGVGIFAALGAVCGGIFLFTTFSLEILTYWELSLMLLGFALVAAELFTGWSAGIGGAVGGLLVLIGGFLSFMPADTGFDWNDPAAAQALGSAFTQMAIASLLAIVGLLVMIAVLPRMRLIQNLSAQGEITATSADPGATSLVGRRGRLTSDCHPGGTVDLDDDPAGQRSARSRYGDYLAKGSRVEVVDVAFGECIVQAVPETAETDDA